MQTGQVSQSRAVAGLVVLLPCLWTIVFALDLLIPGSLGPTAYDREGADACSETGPRTFVLGSGLLLVGTAFGVVAALFLRTLSRWVRLQICGLAAAVSVLSGAGTGSLLSGRGILGADALLTGLLIAAVPMALLLGLPRGWPAGRVLSGAGTLIALGGATVIAGVQVPECW